MTDDTISTLVASSNRGRYALDDPETGHDLTSGPWTPQTQEDFERTVTPRVRAAIQEGMSLADALSAATGQVADLFFGYYFIAGGDGAVCGLCTGMQVRLIEPGGRHD